MIKLMKWIIVLMFLVLLIKATPYILAGSVVVAVVITLYKELAPKISIVINKVLDYICLSFDKYEGER